VAILIQGHTETTKNSRKGHRKSEAEQHEVDRTTTIVDKLLSITDPTVEALRERDIDAAVSRLNTLFEWQFALDHDLPLSGTELQLVQLVKHACQREVRTQAQKRISALGDSLSLLNHHQMLTTVTWLLKGTHYSELEMLIRAIGTMDELTAKSILCKPEAEVVTRTASKNISPLLQATNRSTEWLLDNVDSTEKFLTELLNKSILVPFFDEDCQSVLEVADRLNNSEGFCGGYFDLNKILFQLRGQVCLLALMIYDRLVPDKPTIKHLTTAVRACNDFAICWRVVATIPDTRTNKRRAITCGPREEFKYLMVAQSILTDVSEECWGQAMGWDHRFWSVPYIDFNIPNPYSD
jgi:hypothetical protein